MSRLDNRVRVSMLKMSPWPQKSGFNGIPGGSRWMSHQGDGGS